MSERPGAGDWAEGYADRGIHHRSSYGLPGGRAACVEETVGPGLGADEGSGVDVIHQCDLPAEHQSRHMCGKCGVYFGD